MSENTKTGGANASSLQNLSHLLTTLCEKQGYDALRLCKEQEAWALTYQPKDRRFGCCLAPPCLPLSYCCFSLLELVHAAKSKKRYDFEADMKELLNKSDAGKDILALLSSDIVQTLSLRWVAPLVKSFHMCRYTLSGRVLIL